MRTASSPASPFPARVRISARATILLVLVLLAGTLSINPMRDYLAMRDRQSELERQVRLLEAQNERLATRIGKLNDPTYLERLARACLGMVDPGEIAFVLVPEEGGKPRVPDC